MAKVVIDIAAEYTGNKAFKQAETSTQKLEKSVAKLGKQLLGVFAATKLISFGKTAAKAFAADEKAARSLSLALANTGNAFRGIEVEAFIADLQRATGVLDDNLRPAFRTLLTATGDVTKSQEGLRLALDIAAGTGKDLGAVTAALAKGYTGNVTALSRLGAGLSKATIKTGDMDEITKQLSDKFKGQALAAAKGYSGQMDRLSVASNNAKEIIGKDLLDAMSLISGKDGIGGATTAMEGLATEIGNVIYGIGLLASKVKSIPGFDFIKDIFSVMPGLQTLANFGQNNKPRVGAQSPGERKQIDKINKDALKFQKQQNELAKIDINNTTRKLVLTADQQALEELKKKFDIERISINAALNANIDKETELRLKSLLAIHDNDAALAGKIMAEIAATDAIKNLGDAARQAALKLQTSYSAGLSSFQQSEINSLTQGPAAPGIPDVLTQAMPSVPMSPLQSFRESEARYAGTGGVSISINPAVAGLIDVIQNQSASGISPTVNRVSSSYIA